MNINLEDLLYKLKILLKEFFELDIDYKHSYYLDYPIYILYIYSYDNFISKIYIDYQFNNLDYIYDSNTFITTFYSLEKLLETIDKCLGNIYILKTKDLLKSNLVKEFLFEL